MLPGFCLRGHIVLLFFTTKLLVQARRHGGAFRGRAPQMTACAPSKRGLCPEEINRLGVIGVQIEA